MPQIGYTYNDHNATELSQMVPGFNTAGVRMSRFVVSAWSISNFSSPEMLNVDMVQRVHGMVAAYLSVSVDQVYMSASANVTVGYVFSGITPRDDLKWVPKHLDFFDQTMTGVMRGVSSDMAGGYDKSRIQACGGVPWTAGADVAGQPCGVATRKALRRAGMRVDDAKYQQMIVGKPVVSLDIQLAVGVTDSQQAAGTDQALAAWLAQPGGLISAVSSSPELAFGSDLLIKWLKTPEIWTNLPHKAANKPQTAAWGPNSIAGLAIGMAAAFGLAVGVAVFLLLRWHKGRHAAAAAEPHKADSASDTSSQRNRRRKQGKRRYLLPDPPVPSVAQASAPSDAEAAAETAIVLVLCVGDCI
ncbi:hypothetical protein OEZ86_013530 [Tetradesmus obliquus]|nr:hypothetical protein OEZ86_013530 [Tetradesmus obliquus]